MYLIKFKKYLEKFHLQILQNILNTMIEDIKDFKIWEKLESKEAWKFFGHFLLIIQEKDNTR